MLRLHNRYKNLAGLSESTQPPDNSAIDVEKSEPVNISEDCVPPSTYTPYLPAELWLQIINHLRWNTDVYNLSQTSRFLRPIALSTCKTLDLSIFEPIAEFDFSILCASRIPARASIVKELRVTLLCRKGEGTLPECECDIFDRGLELALHAMVNLQDLDITCLLCRASNSTRHAYIITPDAPRQHATQLRTLSFICSGHGHIYPPDENQIDSPLLFDSPLFNSVEVLRWRRWRPRDHPAGSPVKGLPKLKAIASSGKALENTLLATRPIQRLHIVDLYVAYEPFLRALEMSMTSLTHLIHVDLARLNIILSTTRLVFPNLRHIGTLEYNEVGWALYDYL